MSAELDLAKAIADAVNATIASLRPESSTMPATYQGTDAEGKGWVLLPGATEPTPVSRMAVEADLGDTVSVTIANGKATVDSNISNPSAGLAGVKTVTRVVNVAKETAATAIDYAGAALSAASVAKQGADRAAAKADEASTSADIAHAAAKSAQADAATARESAESAVADAATANESATVAMRSANTALVGLSEVENVVGTLNWIAEHGRYVSAAGTEFDEARIYYIYDEDSTQYVAVEDPDPEDIADYFYLVIDDSVQNYIATHLALMDDGLHVNAGSDDYSVVLSSDGMEVRNPYGKSVAMYGETARIGAVDDIHLLAQATRMSFRSDAGDVAYIGMGDDEVWRLFIDQADVEDSIRFGNYAWVKRPNGNMTIKYVESGE